MNRNLLEETYDVAVVGAGHAGCEAALAAATDRRRNQNNHFTATLRTVPSDMRTMFMPRLRALRCSPATP